MSGSQLNPSIALQAGQGVTQPVNLLAQYGQAQQLQQNALAIQSNQQNLKSRLAIGDAAQQSINPDGTVDQGKFRTLVSQNPDAAWGAQAAVGTSQDQQDEAYKVNTAALNQSTGRAGVFSTALTPLLAEGKAVQPEDVYSVVARLHAAGVPVDGAVDQIGATMPHTGGAALRTWIMQNATGSGGLPTSDALPKPDFVPTGGAVTGIDGNPISNPGVTSTSLPVTMSPREATDQITLKAPDGTSYSIPRAQLAQYQGQGRLVTPNAAPNGGSNAFGSGRYSQGGGAGAPSSGSPFDGQGAGGTSAFGSPPAGAPPGAVTTDLSPGSTAARTVLGTQSGSQAAALFTSAQGSPDRKAMLSNMEADLADAPTGPGSQNQAYWSAFANAHAPGLAKVFGGSLISSPSDVASYEAFEKTASKFAQAQAGSLGVVTDDKLGAAMTSNPNTAFSTLGNSGVIHMLQGNEDAIGVRNTAWQNYLQGGGDPAKFQAWATNFNNSGFDPRVFQLQNMTPDERTKYLGTLNPSQTTGLFNNIRTAFSKGWTTPTTFSGGAGAGAGAPAGSGTTSSAASPPPSGPSVPVGNGGGY